ncbi:hypothetical protein KHQ08_00785 (plasmid) [Pseudochrobactrum algeriensis]|uniref:hypothetical protein n=1 Tax=Pseudochrobactrum algeriensis TaxID=2834768 RepID=UPI001BCD2554|nr:hypothetical protein [Pseudochrobactrum algeriensis]QVQ35463.1 hypothetical protein KHQ08_00785 [Pseudochrobactrum algeriensis]QVQ42079.1 hypothetical protein KHQ07_16655 [Pseudochrobactrum algeriensis]QVQ42337.1 hypothetical protein KHQ09_01450 [Pseudochrobactrum algeriensis]
MANEKTPNYHWDIPNPYGLQIVEMIKVASTFGAIDSRFKAFEDAYISHKHSFADITDRPTTLNGYGITDAITTDQVRSEIETSQAAQQSVIDQSIQSLTNSTADALALRVRVDSVQAFTLAQKSRARQNIDALGTVDRGVPNGVATLDAAGKIPSSQLPPVAIADTFVVNSQPSMLALVAERGDVAVRTDLKKTFILRLEPATVLANWQEMLTPTDQVLSVNGQTGVINLSAEDVGAATPAQVAAKLDRNNPNFTGRGIGTHLSLRNGNSDVNRNLLGFGFTGDADDTQKWILRSDGVLVLCKMNPATGAWERDLLQVHPTGVVQAANTLKVSGAEVHTNGNVSGAMWDLTGTLDLWNYINKMTWGKTSVEIGFAVFNNEDWPWRETVAPWTKCLAFCVSKTDGGSTDNRRRPRNLEGQHDWGWETWAQMIGGADQSGVPVDKNDPHVRSSLTVAYTTMGRFRVNAGWGRTSERIVFLRVA